MSRSERNARIGIGAGLLALMLFPSGCASDSTNVCEDEGNCSHGGDRTFIDGCQHNANLLQSQAHAAGCTREYNVYFSCAAELAALDACLARATDKSACAALDDEERRCAPPSDGGADAGSVPLACTASRECEARCFLDQVENVCAPRVDELSAFVTCATTCPP